MTPRDLVILFAFLAIYVDSGESAEEWCYEGKCGPRYWKGKCKFGEIQSPINIVPAKTIKSKPGRKLKFNKQYYAVNQFQIINNGHTVQLSLNTDETSNLQVEGAGFRGTYNFAQMHFHWGKNNKMGAEHAIKGKRFPLELHLVHANANGGIGVLGLIFGIQKTANKALQPIIDALESVNSVSEEPVPMEAGVNLTALFPNVWDVFRYSGSLTTPPCTEEILWSVFTQRMPVSSAQVAAFRKVLDANGKPITRNFRNIKPFKTKGRDTIYWMPINKKKMISEAF